MRRSQFVSIVSLGCAALLAGCANTLNRDTGLGDSLWIPASHEAFVSIENDTLYTIVPSTESDMYIHEKMSAKNHRLTWIVRVPRGAPLERVHRILADGDSTQARAWLVEEIEGRPTTFVPAEGTVVLHSRSLAATQATFVLEALVGHAPAGQILPDVLRLSLRDSWDRHERNPKMWSPRFSRSGAHPDGAGDPSDPFAIYDAYETGER